MSNGPHERVEPNRIVRCPHCAKPLFSVDASGTKAIIRCGGCATDHALVIAPAQLGFVRGTPPQKR